MAKVADVKLSWQRSVSTDLQSRVITVRINGNESTYTVAPEVESYQITVEASSNVSFFTTVFDVEGKQVSSETASFQFGDLEDPQPDTLLGIEVVGVREITPA